MIRMSKGMAIETVIYLALAVISLIVLWMFFSSIAPPITAAIVNLINDVKCSICDMIGVLDKFVGQCGNCGGKWAKTS